MGGIVHHDRFAVCAWTKFPEYYEHRLHLAMVETYGFEHDNNEVFDDRWIRGRRLDQETCIRIMNEFMCNVVHTDPEHGPPPPEKDFLFLENGSDTFHRRLFDRETHDSDSFSEEEDSEEGGSENDPLAPPENESEEEAEGSEIESEENGGETLYAEIVAGLREGNAGNDSLDDYPLDSDYEEESDLLGNSEFESDSELESEEEDVLVEEESEEEEAEGSEIESEDGEGEEDDDLTNWTVQELRAWLGQRGLPVDGGEPVLVWRVEKVMELNAWNMQELRDWLREREVRRNGDKDALVARVTRMEELNAYWTVKELRDWLRVRGLPMNGDKDALVARVARVEGY